MMAPPRCFIIGRLAARMSAKAPLRLVSSCLSQSSSFTRMTRPSTATPGVVDQHVQPAVRLDELSMALAHAAVSATSNLTASRLGARRLDELDRLLGRGLVAGVADDDRGAPALANATAHAAADAARAAGDQHHLVLEVAHAQPPSAASVFSRLAASSTLNVSMSLAMRLTSPHSTLPGPSSTTRVTPCGLELPPRTRPSAPAR